MFSETWSPVPPSLLPAHPFLSTLQGMSKDAPSGPAQCLPVASGVPAEPDSGEQGTGASFYIPLLHMRQSRQSVGWGVPAGQAGPWASHCLRKTGLFGADPLCSPTPGSPTQSRCLQGCLPPEAPPDTLMHWPRYNHPGAPAVLLHRPLPGIWWHADGG